MKTRDLLKLPDLKLAQAISTMKGKECEKHARNYTKILGIEFEEAIMHATHAAMFSQNDEPSNCAPTKPWNCLNSRGNGIEGR